MPIMEYALFGKTGMRVSRFCMGAMTFGNETDEAGSVAIMNRAEELGINFFDTSNNYNNGRSEEILGRWIKSRRDTVVVATKAHFPVGPGPNDHGSSRRHLTLSVEASLRRLGTDRLDILYLHHWDEDTDLEQTLSAVDWLVQQGKVLYLGVSNFSAWQTMKALGLSQFRQYAPVVCLQPMYNLVKRQAEVELFPLALEEDLAVCPYNPLAAGLLTGKYQKNQTGRIQENDMYRERYRNGQYWEVSDRFVQFAAARGVSPAGLAMAWVASHPAVTSPILGARNLDQLNDTLSCLDLEMTPELRAEIGALSIAPPLATDR